MVGLTVILETQKDGDHGVTDHSTTPHIMINYNNRRCRHSSSSSSSSSLSSKSPTKATSFLDCCFLCSQKLLPGKDIYMYEGDKGFCSQECRCRQIFIDEQQTMLDVGNCSFAAAINPQTTPSPPL